MTATRPLLSSTDFTNDLLIQRLETLKDERAVNCPMSSKELARYAHSIVSASGVQPGEALTISLLGEEDIILAEEVAINAYLRGVSKVRLVGKESLHPTLQKRLHEPEGRTLIISAPEDALTWEESVEEGAAHLIINDWPEGPTDSLDSQTDANIIRWCWVYWPSPTLAREAFLGGPQDERVLAERLLDFSRNLPSDPLGGYAQHVARLKEIAAALNKLDLAEITIENGTTSLRVGLLQASKFAICDWETTSGQNYECNFPSEEIFFTPNPEQVEGHLQSTTPCNIGPYAILSLEAEIKNGLVQRRSFKATPKNLDYDPEIFSDTVYSYLESYPEALRLGEAALVGIDSRVWTRGEFYGINNLDENAGIHVALGDSYLAGLEGMREDIKDGAKRNRSPLHCDIVLSQGQADVWGMTREGDKVDIMKAGVWQTLEVGQEGALWEL